jgi:peptidoglycan/xylan/chitin deacetylase (PgdA/CDA1 family)
MFTKEQYLFPVLRRTAERLPFRQLRRVSQLPLIPLYHAVSEVPSPYVRHVGVWRSLQSFREDLEFFLEHYEPVSLQELLNHKKTQKPPFYLTFDDGLIECWKYVVPILKEAGLPASFFVNSAFVDNRELFFRFKASMLIHTVIEQAAAHTRYLDWAGHYQIAHEAETYLKSIHYGERAKLDELAAVLEVDFDAMLSQRPCYMGTEMLRDLQGQGFHIGAHSIDHPRYDALPVEEQLRQTLVSMDFVQKRFKPKVRAFAFPFTDYNIRKEFFAKLTASNDCDATFGCAGLKKERIRNHLQRVPMDENKLSAHANLSREYLYYLLKMPLGKNVFSRQ